MGEQPSRIGPMVVFENRQFLLGRVSLSRCVPSEKLWNRPRTASNPSKGAKMIEVGRNRAPLVQLTCQGRYRAASRRRGIFEIGSPAVPIRMQSLEKSRRARDRVPELFVQFENPIHATAKIDHDLTISHGERGSETEGCERQSRI